MHDQPGATSAVTEPITVINDHGIIESITMPEGFVKTELSEDESYNYYLECRIPGTAARICYEQSDTPFFREDRQAVERLLTFNLPTHGPRRQLNLSFNDDGSEENPEDASAYYVLGQAFIFGGNLVRDGASIDEQSSTWEVLRVGKGKTTMTIIVGNLRFYDSRGAKAKRRACLTLPILPGAGGCGYLWLEGTEADLKKYEEIFLDSVVGEGRFKELAGEYSEESGEASEDWDEEWPDDLSEEKPEGF
jgi:hypothetical protein